MMFFIHYDGLAVSLKSLSHVLIFIMLCSKICFGSENGF